MRTIETVRWLRSSACGVLLLAALALAGCSHPPEKPWGTARGRITSGAQPIGNGSVAFVNLQTGVSLMGNIEGDGSYVLASHESPGIPVGDYRVVVTPRKIGHGEQPPVTRGAKPKPRADIPEKFRVPETTPLTAQVKVGTNPVFDFDLAR